MIGAVVDANVIASGVLGLNSSTSIPGVVVREWQRKRYWLFTSEHLIAEVRRTLDKPFFASRLAPDDVAATLTSLRADAVLVEVVIVEHGIATHPEDDVVLATAVAADADYLVTGDRQLLKLGDHRGVAIVSPSDFLTLLEAGEQRQAADDRDAAT